MTRFAAILVLACAVGTGQKFALTHKTGTGVSQGVFALNSAVSVARDFLPPHTQLATLYTFNYRTLKYGRDFPAVLQAHVTSTEATDIVFAYYSPRANTMSKTLFVDLLEKTPSGYEKIFEISYRPQILFVSKAIRVVRLEGIDTDAVAVIHGIGADLGGQLNILVWRDPWGWRNVFPRNGGVHYFYFFKNGVHFDVALSSSKHPGLEVSPPPVWYHWEGKKFVEIPPPRGSSKWSLPD